MAVKNWEIAGAARALEEAAATLRSCEWEADEFPESAREAVIQVLMEVNEALAELREIPEQLDRHAAMLAEVRARLRYS